MTSQLVYQRIRNRVIEMLEWFVACEDTPPEVGMNELVNFWEDFVSIPLAEKHFPVPVFTPGEEVLIRDVSLKMDAFCDATPRSMQDHLAAVCLPQWKAVAVAAQAALAEMMKRGRMPEDHELTEPCNDQAQVQE